MLNMELNKSDKMITFNEMNKGSIVSGTVKNIKPYGAFIQTDNGIDGLLYIEDISVARIKTPAERLNVGQKKREIKAGYQ